jgi:diadenylate cyclase
MEDFNCDFSPVKHQLKETMIKIRDELNNSIEAVNNEENCLLCKLEEIKKECMAMEVLASSFYLTCYLSAFTDKYEELSKSAQHLSQKKHGALIVIERSTPVDDYIQKGVPIGAVMTPSLLETIFYPGNPLHDGAVLIRGNIIVSAANVLPLTAQVIIGKKLGTRHRAALGLSDQTDALVLVVSEETGKVSFALNGRLYPIHNTLEVNG